MNKIKLSEPKFSIMISLALLVVLLGGRDSIPCECPCG
jgi:hypothetical protein